MFANFAYAFGMKPFDVGSLTFPQIVSYMATMDTRADKVTESRTARRDPNGEYTEDEFWAAWDKSKEKGDDSSSGAFRELIRNG